MKRTLLHGDAMRPGVPEHPTEVRELMSDLLPGATFTVQDDTLVGEIEGHDSHQIASDLWKAHIDMLSHKGRLFSRVDYAAGHLTAGLVRPEAGITSVRIGQTPRLHFRALAL